MNHNQLEFKRTIDLRQGLRIIKDLRNLGARERGVVQKACSALLRGFVPRSPSARFP